jgi:SP family facilitated glucose transporter-like MFS transporter 1
MDEMAQEQKNQGLEVSYKDLFIEKKYYRPLICAAMLQFSQQFSGIGALASYSTSIFISVGLKDELAVYSTIILALVQLIMGFITTILIERTGRRPLLLIGLSGMCISVATLAIFIRFSVII